MQIDSRLSKLAKNLVNYSCAVKSGDKVLIEASDVDYQFVVALVREIYATGGKPFTELSSNRIKKSVLENISAELADDMARYASTRMKEMNCYIGIRGGENSLELSGVPSDRLTVYSKHFSHPVHHELRVKKTRWVVLRYPTQGMSQQANMSTESFEDFYFDVCNLNYGKMDKAMDALSVLMDKTDKVRITAKDTDITFSIKGIPAVKCSGRHNIPDGEIYTAPVKNSVNGTIAYNTSSIHNGRKYENVKLTFKDGRIIDASANFTKELNAELDTDEGARYVGEFAIGVNPHITQPTGDILFDEKISGSIHFTPGACYDEASNGNVSAVHWDLVLMQTPESGGGKIYFDDTLIRKDGLFVLPELKCLNPENLK